MINKIKSIYVLQNSTFNNSTFNNSTFNNSTFGSLILLIWYSKRQDCLVFILYIVFLLFTSFYFFLLLFATYLTSIYFNGKIALVSKRRDVLLQEIHLCDSNRFLNSSLNTNFYYIFFSSIWSLILCFRNSFSKYQLFKCGIFCSENIGICLYQK